MTTPHYARTMADYNAELNRRVYGAAMRLPDTTRREDGGAFWKSIHGTLNHILWADRMWLSRFGVGTQPEVPIKQSDTLVSDFEDLWRRRQDFDAVIIDWARALSSADFEGDLAWWSGAQNKEMTKPRSLLIMQIFNHQTHHRGQAHALITRAGEDTGATDLPFVLD